MHLTMIFVALGLAWFLRTFCYKSGGSWRQRTFRAIALFLFPPMLLIVTAFALLCMGPAGQMIGLQSGWFSYLLAWVFLGWAIIKLFQFLWEGWCSVKKIRTYPRMEIGDRRARILETDIPYSALVGFWQPELVISQGLLNTLNRDCIDAVIAHEQAHYYYRDTFWFFWLGWMRSITAWLPNTDALWQELLVLRELRADNWAAQIVDPLILAESLLLVVSTPVMTTTNFCAAFSAIAPQNRLMERVEALLATDESPHQLNWWYWVLLLPAFLPLVAIPFHN